MTDDRPRHLFTAAEAEKAFGISASTIRNWRRRRLLWHYGLDWRNRPMYDREHLIALRENRLTREQQARGRRRTVST